jgi:hypothetical protein
MSLAELTFLLRKWENTQSQITHVRKKVFMDEYNLPINFLRHKDDAERYHVVAYDDLTSKPVGTGCIHRDGHIGRIAILAGWRKTNSVAHVIIDYLMHVAKALKVERVWLNAPTESLDFFVKQDFYPMGEPFEYYGLSMQKIEAWLDIEKNKNPH